jgi:heme/copper-type cytochrome/quinol oxidase subunit 1
MATYAAPIPQIVAHKAEPEQHGWASWITTTDHKRIGIMYMVTTFVFFLLGGVEALMMRLQLGVPENTLIAPQTYNQLFTMHGTTMIFLFVVPMMAGLANYFVPLMVGARDMAFPRLNALSYWLLLAGGIVFYASIFWNPPEAGWTSYVPLSSITYSPGGGQDAWIYLIHLTGLSSILGALNFYVTIANMRARGMSWGRLPLFIWAILTYSILIIFAMPVIAGAVTMLLTDRHFGTHFFDPTNGGSALLWQNLFWFFGHPEVYIMVLPGFGLVSEIVPVFARKPIFGYKAIAASTVTIAFLGFLVWVHHMFTAPIPEILIAFAMLSSCLIAIPTGVKIFGWLGTLWGRRHLGHIPRRVPRRLAAQRNLFRGRPHPLRLDGRFGVHDLRCDLLLVPEDHRPDDERGPGQTQLLPDVLWLPRNLLDPARDRPRRHAEARIRVQRHRQPRALQPDLHDRLVHPRRRCAVHGHQRRPQPQARRRGGS